MISTADLLTIAPELFLLGAICALLLIDLFFSGPKRNPIHFLALLALIGTALLTWRESPLATGTRLTALGGLFVRDAMGDVLKLFIYLVTGASFVYARSYLSERGLLKGEFYLLCLFAVLGMMVLVSAGSLITIYLGLELMALSTYALVALHRDNLMASEAAMKYFVLGALASGMLLYGLSMIYGATGSLDLATIHAAANTTGERSLLLFGLVFMVAGVAFKFGAAPFHMWLPDVYHGAPTAITVFIGSAPKLAVFGMTYRLLEGGGGALSGYWHDLVAWLAVLSLAIGNLIAIAQTNLKRMLAYSTISHVGFLFLGLANATPEGYAAALFYTVCYALMAAGAFATIVLLSKKDFEADNIDDFKGLNRRHPWYALLVLCLMASLAGFPPFLGFWAKLVVLNAAVDADMIWLAIVGAVFAVVGAFYYLRVVKVMYFDTPAENQTAIAADSSLRVMLTVNALAMLVLGLFWNPLMALCQRVFGV